MGKPKPTIQEVMPFGHLHIVIQGDLDAGKTYGVFANYNKPNAQCVFSGVIESATGTELRRIAGVIDRVTVEQDAIRLKEERQRKLNGLAAAQKARGVKV